MSVITIPKVLREKLGDEAADALAEVIREVEKDAYKEVATKADLAEAKVEIIKWVAGMLVAQAVIIAALVKLL